VQDVSITLIIIYMYYLHSKGHLLGLSFSLIICSQVCENYSKVMGSSNFFSAIFINIGLCIRYFEKGEVIGLCKLLLVKKVQFIFVVSF
jgi:hypothetical protein